MLRFRIVFVLLMLSFSSSVSAQWSTRSFTDDFTGEQTNSLVGSATNGLRMTVSCSPEAQIVSLFRIEDTELFHHGDVDVRWDGGTVESYSFVDRDEFLHLGGAGGSQQFIRKMRLYNELVFRVTMWRDDYVTGRISLAGTDGLLTQIGCN